MKNAAIVIVVLAIIGGGAFALTSNKDKPNNGNNRTDTTSQSSTNKTASETGSEQSSSSTITYSDDGFSPNNITVKAGTTVTIKNNSSRSLQFDSDPHPAHTDNEELNVETVPEGGSKTFTVKRTGTFGYHNHLNPGETGTIIVE